MQFTYGMTGPFIAPFEGLLGQPRFEGRVVEVNSLVAIFVYALIAWMLVKIVGCSCEARGVACAQHRARS